jgi:hypothetical protein
MRHSRMRTVALSTFVLLSGLGASSRAAPQVDSSKLPDIVGVHLGMSLAQAKAAFAKAYTSRIDALALAYGPGGGSVRSVYTMRTQTPDYKSSMAVDITLPPNPQVVWHVGRGAPQPNVHRSVLLAALRKKYGKETVAISDKTRMPTTDDNDIALMYWVMDEQGHPVSGTPPFINGSPYGCTVSWGSNGTQPTTPKGLPDYCAQSFVGIYVSMGPLEIITQTSTEMVDYPVLFRALAATDAFTQNGNQRIQQQQEQKSKEIKPAL